MHQEIMAKDWDEMITKWFDQEKIRI